MFGMLYGIGVFALYTLDLVGAPTFYDKLLCVPLLNLSVIVIDRMVRSIDSEAALNLWKSSWSVAGQSGSHERLDSGVWPHECHW